MGAKKKASKKRKKVPSWVGVLQEHISTQLNGFSEGMDAKLELLESRLGERISAVEVRLERVEMRLDKLETRVGRLEERVDRVEERMGRVQDAIRTHSQEIGHLRRRVG